MSASLRKGGQDSNRAFSDPSRESHSLVSFMLGIT